MLEIIPCPSCQRRLRLPSDALGQLVKCPACEREFIAPAGFVKSEATPDGPSQAGIHEYAVQDAYDPPPRDEPSERPRRRREVDLRKSSSGQWKFVAAGAAVLIVAAIIIFWPRSGHGPFQKKV